MHAILEHEHLLKALTAVRGAAVRDQNIPIFSCVLLEADGDACKMTAANLDMQISYTIPAKIKAKGAVCTNVYTFNEIVRNLAAGAQLSLKAEKKNDRLALIAGRSNFSLSVLPVEDFPDLNQDGFSHEFSLTAADLRTLISKTQFAISGEEGRYYLHGIYFHIPANEGNKPALLRAAATDGHRLAFAEIPCPQGAAALPGMIVPRKTVAEFARLAEHEGKITVAAAATMVRYESGPVVILSKIIDGAFPDYARVIPSGNDKMATLEREAFAKAVQRVASVYTGADERATPVKLALSKGKLALSAQDAQQGSAAEEMEAEYDGDSLEIGFNYRYLLDIAERIDGALRLEIADSAQAVIIRDCGDASVLYVLMPMRV